MKSINLNGNKNIIDILNKKKLRINYVFFSSTLLYKFSKKKIDKKSKIFLNDEYKKSKYLSEKYINKFYEKHFIIRLSNVYDHNFGSIGFLHHLKKAILSDNIFYVANTLIYRNFIHVNDLVNIVLRLIKKKEYGTHNIFNENFKLGQIINLFFQIFKKKILVINLGKSLRDENSQKFLFTKKQKSIYKPKNTLKKTIKKFYANNVEK